MVKTSLIFVLRAALIMVAACKKEVTQPSIEKKIPMVSTSGNAGFKGEKQADKKQPPANQLKRNGHFYKGRFETKYGLVDGVKFYSKDGNTIYLEQSKLAGSKTYNIVTDNGRYFKNEVLKMGISKSEMLAHGEKEKWPDHIMHAVKHHEGDSE
ncbi:MAG: hypothetical protein U0X71_01745 [Sphingobacteriaceae bacterium]|jgi:hypothetical protein|nr:MAG: hypothetical protein E6Q66_00740 [Pedobacter sp.]